MTTKERKTFKNLNVRISPELKDKVEKYKQETGTVLEKFVPEALEDFFKKKKFL